MDYKSFCSTRYILGNGSIAKLGELKGKKLALVVDENILQALGLSQKLFGELLVGFDYRVVCNVPHEPSMELLAKPIEDVREYQPDYFVAIGGGSVMDAAKALWLFYELPHYDWDKATIPYGVEPFPGKAQMIAVPTTSGTGSETTCCSMIKGDDGVKRMILSFEIVPTMAILDYDLLKSLPAKNIAYSGTDALAHALGAAVCKSASELVRAAGIQASVMLVKNLVPSSKGDQEARKAVHIGATLAGQAINNSMTGIEHSMAKAGEVFDLPHGLVSGLMLPYVMRLQIPNPVYAEVADQLGLTGGDAEKQEKLVDLIWSVYDEMGMPRTFQAVGVDQAAYLENLPGHMEQMKNEFGLDMAPRRPTEAELELLFKQFYYGI